MPLRTVRMHHSGKPWVMPGIKALIRDRQKAFIKGEREKYERLKNKVAELMMKAKQNYYNNKVNNSRHTNPAKWFKLNPYML